MSPCVWASQAETCLTSGGVQRPRALSTARCYFNTHHYHTISPFSFHPSFPSKPASLWSFGEQTTGLWHPLRAKPFSLTSWDSGGGRNRPACVCRFPWGALALDAGPDQCDLNSNCELEGCQWERTLCKWAQAAWGPQGPLANQVPPPPPTPQI